MRYVKITFLLLFLTLLLIFVFENMGALSLPVSLRYDLAFVVLGPLEIPLYALLFLAIFCGVISVAIVDIMVLFRQRRRMKKKDKQIKDLETELEKFRNLPLTEAVVSDVELTTDKPDATTSVTQ
ncbi:MAG: LapA family protein [Pseudomonadota bacterium]|nr:LapA family protein [Pseudomonadota bacterium]MEA3241389.1 LapA family protein [Pseudomonadota bacterium]